MPVVVELRMKASWPLKPDTRQLHGLACALFEGNAAASHLSQDKPFSVWPLRPVPGADGQAWVLRAAWLRGGPPPAGLISRDKLRVGHVTCAVTEMTHRTATHAQLAGGPGLEHAELRFLSPTYFSHNGSSVVTPDPRLIAGSWRRTWNACLPEGDELRVGDETWREIHRNASLAAFELRTTKMDSGRGHARAGFTGSATLRLDRAAPAAAMSAFAALARFAEFCGTGAQTTHGFGATSLAATARPS